MALDFPSFVNFTFDSKDYITVWFVGHPLLTRKIDRHIAFSSHVYVRYKLQPITDKEQFKELIIHGFAQAGSKHTILSDSAINILHISSQGNQRLTHRIIITTLRIANEAIIFLKQR